MKWLKRLIGNIANAIMNIITLGIWDEIKRQRSEIQKYKRQNEKLQKENAQLKEQNKQLQFLLEQMQKQIQKPYSQQQQKQPEQKQQQWKQKQLEKQKQQQEEQKQQKFGDILNNAIVKVLNDLFPVAKQLAFWSVAGDSAETKKANITTLFREILNSISPDLLKKIKKEDFDNFVNNVYSQLKQRYNEIKRNASGQSDILLDLDKIIATQYGGKEAFINFLREIFVNEFFRIFGDLS